ncbi:YheC/YheD family protein [Paucisalibacillus sp. EB02]|uniref:YheC/YheD family protein n=1 Tax=Paucisalibacillus sp. EB02 TaxID=1347087 RepID=UPI001E31AD2A|nr:YheC/YheD family protein [Paucisalibacillus sp. EB02]
MRNFIKPPIMAEITARFCKAYGLDMVYALPSGVDMVNNKVKGKMLIDDTWIDVTTDLPTFFDISPYCFKAKNSKIMNYLRKNTILSDDRTNLLSKEKLQDKLVEDEKFSHLVIPTEDVKDVTTVKNFVQKYGTIVLKPLRGERGKGVYILTEKMESYILGYKKSEKEISFKDLEMFVKERTEERKYIMQKYINSRTNNGDPFDCRVHVEKNGEGKWQIARKYIRIGIGQKVISNVNQGGGIADSDVFFKANFPDLWEEIELKLDELGNTLPYKIEELRGTSIMSLGMDVAVHSDGSLSIFEVNGAPATAALKAEAALLRTQYYVHMLKKINRK